MSGWFNSVKDACSSFQRTSGTHEVIIKNNDRANSSTVNKQQKFREQSCPACFCGMSVYILKAVEKMTLTPWVGLAESSKWYNCVCCCCLTSYLAHVCCEKTAFGCREGPDGSEEVYFSFKKHSCGDALKRVEGDLESAWGFVSCSGGKQASTATITSQPSYNSSRSQLHSQYQQPYSSWSHDNPFYVDSSVRRK